MNEIVIIALAGFTTGITTVLFGFGGGFVVVPFVYQLMLRQPAIADNAMHVAVATSTAVIDI
ncbi:integral membrane protein [Klebsiella pneumoniae]|uniref:Integral membrane protein n=1 Tax=Klebsiella pneumoniae TaxID=573 RepID=A0A2X3IY14_KLEPN|nr:integral membrane protein [Klebsiella pneumoniae]